MPVFDDPKKNLHRLQQELLAEEEEYEEDYLSEDDWLDQELAEARVLAGLDAEPEAPVRGSVQQRSYLSGYSAYQQERPAYESREVYYEDEEIDEEEEQGIRGLVALAVVLTLGIVAVAAYWVLVLLR